MKKTSTIKLLLLTAGFASCNQGMQPAKRNNWDWVYVPDYPYPYISSYHDSTSLYQQTLPSVCFDNWFYIKHSGFIKGSVTRSAHFVVRGGFGGHGFASS